MGDLETYIPRYQTITYTYMMHTTVYRFERVLTSTDLIRTNYLLMHAEQRFKFITTETTASQPRQLPHLCDSEQYLQ